MKQKTARKSTSSDWLVVTTVPEPMTLTLFGIGIMGLGALSRRCRREV